MNLGLGSGDDLTAGRAVDGVRGTGGQQGSSGKLGRPQFPAGKTVAGRHLLPSVTAVSGELGSNGRLGLVEGTGGFKELFPGPPFSEYPGNVGQSKSAWFLPESAQEVLDPLPVRDPKSKFVCDIPTVAGDVWEKGPESVIEDGSTVQAFFHPPGSMVQPLPVPGNPDASSQSIRNPRSTHQSGALPVTRIVLDDHSDGPRRGGSVPVRVAVVAGYLASAGRPGRDTDSAILGRGGISCYGDLGSSGAAL